MSLGSIKGGQPAVLDLLSAASPASASRRALPSADKAGGDAQPRFGEVLDQSAKRVRRPGRERSEGDDVVRPIDQNDKAGRVDTDSSETSSAGEAESVSSDSKQGGEAQPETPENEQANTQREADGGQADAAQAEAEADADAEAVVQQQAAAAAAQARSEQAGGLDFVFGPTATGVKAEQSPEQVAAYAGSEAEQQAQAVAAQMAADTLARHQGKPNAPLQGPVVFATATAQQQGAQAQAGDTDARSDSSATAKATVATQTQANASAASTVFNVPDQPAGESRLPLNPAGTTPHADAAKALQAQPLATRGDDDAVNTARLTRGLANAVQQRGGAVTLRLTPPEMGTVRIQMQITGTNVSASFHAESASAQTLLTQQLSQLRTALETQGMNVEKLSVQPLASTSQGQSASQNQNDNNPQQGQNHNPSANDGRSRGQYTGQQGGRSSGGDQDPDTPSHQQPRRGFFDRLSDAAEPTAA